MTKHKIPTARLALTAGLIGAAAGGACVDPVTNAAAYATAKSEWRNSGIPANKFLTAKEWEAGWGLTATGQKIPPRGYGPSKPELGTGAGAGGGGGGGGGGH